MAHDFRGFYPLLTGFFTPRPVKTKNIKVKEGDIDFTITKKQGEKRGRGLGTSIVQIMVSCDLLPLTKLNPIIFSKDYQVMNR